jgi:hypothetical protein
MASYLAHDQEISRSITYARDRTTRNNHRAENRESKTASARYSHHAHEQPIE